MIHGMEITRPSGKPVLRSTDKNLILDLTYFMHQYKSTSVVMIVRLQTLKQSATEGIKFLQKEYHLK